MIGPATLRAKNATVLALAALGSIAYGWPAAASLVAGGVVQAVNLWGLERNVSLLFGEAHPSGMVVQALLGLRIVGFLAAVGVVLQWTEVAPIPFVIGLSTAVPAALWHGLEHAARRPREEA